MLHDIARRYKIRRELGSGGMGIVYEAMDRETGRRVALKTLVKMNAAALLRFKQEFRSLADLNHPNLVRLYELQEDQGTWFYTMELVDGLDFIQYVRGRTAPSSSATGPSSGSHGPIGRSPTIPTVTAPSNQGSDSHPILTPWDPSLLSPGFSLEDRPDSSVPRDRNYNRQRLVSALIQLTDALQTIHNDGKVHRDIKPSNILVTDDGRVVLLDFGLVMGIDRNDPNQMTGAGFAGTAGYMAPEAASGRDIGPAADWYSVGVILYEVLTGRLPFEGKALEIILKKQKEVPKSPLVLNPGCDGDLADLAVKLLDSDPNRRPGPETVLDRLGQSRTIPENRRSNRLLLVKDKETFVGRKHELEQFSASWEKALAGRSQAMLVTGSSGIGKTALIHRFKEIVRKSTDGAAYLYSGKCYERETVPFKAFDAVVDRITSSLVKLDRKHSPLPPPEWITYLASMFPVLGRVKSFEDDIRRSRFHAPDPAEGRKLAFGALASLLESISLIRPVLIFVDDVQWIDNDSLELLESLVRHLHDREPTMKRVMLLLARRPTCSHEATSILAKLIQEDLIQEMQLRPLTLSDAQNLARALLQGADIDKPGLPDRVAGESEGNPFFIGEMVRSLSQRKKKGTGSDRIPANLTLADVITERISDLSPTGRRILDTLAVSGEAIPHSVLASAANVPMSGPDWWNEISFLRTRRLAWCNGFRGRDLIEVYHDKIRETLLSLLDDESQRRIHGNIARAMEASSFPSVHRLAHHWLATGDGNKAKRYVIEAARQAADMFAFDRAAALYLEALDLEKDPNGHVNLLLGLGDALANGGQVAQAADAYSRAASLAQDVVVRLDARYKSADQKLKGGYLDEGLDEIRKVLAEVGYTIPKSGKSALLWAGYERARLKIRGLSYSATPRAKIRQADRLALDVLWSVSAGLSVAEPVSSTLFQTKLMRRALDLGDETMIAAGLAMEASLMAASGASKITRARRLVSKAEALARRMGDAKILGRVLLAHTLVSFFAGEWQRCIDWGTKTRDHLRKYCHGMGWELSMAQTFVGFSLMKIGDIAALRKLVWPLLDQARRSGNRFLVANMAAMPQAWLAENKTEELAEILDHVLDTWPVNRYQMHHWYRLFGRGELLLYENRPEDAWNIMQGEATALKHSFVSRVAVIAIQIMRLRGRIALAMAQRSTGPTKRRFLRLIRRAVDGLYRQGFSYGDAWADLLQAGLTWMETHDRGKTEPALRKAVGSLKASDMILDVLAAKWRLADISGQREDLARIKKQIKDRGVQSPERMVEVLAPGFDTE